MATRGVRSLVFSGVLLVAACSKPAPPPADAAPSAAPPVSAAPLAADSTLPVAPPAPHPRTPEDERFLAGLHQFCAAVREVKADPKIAKKDQALAIVKLLAKKKPAPEFLEFLASLQSAGTGSTKYQRLVDAAEAHGEPGYRCPEMADDF